MYAVRLPLSTAAARGAQRNVASFGSEPKTLTLASKNMQAGGRRPGRCAPGQPQVLISSKLGAAVPLPPVNSVGGALTSKLLVVFVAVDCVNAVPETRIHA